MGKMVREVATQELVDSTGKLVAARQQEVGNSVMRKPLMGVERALMGRLGQVGRQTVGKLLLKAEGMARVESEGMEREAEVAKWLLEVAGMAIETGVENWKLDAEGMEAQVEGLL